VIKLFVGLGNPGFEYQDTRHNAGFWWIEALAAKLKLTLNPERAYKGLMARGTYSSNSSGQAFWLLMPQTFMNLSGQSVGALAHFYKIKPEEILVIHDELDIPPGQVKVKFGGGHAGHNGLRDIHAKLGSSDYWRLRIGVGHPGVREEVINWVLQKPMQEHRESIHACIAKSLEAAPLLLAGQMDAATKLIHTKPKPAP
jgi:peptidyl-tRNA hydrolase, PTH1 family